MTALMGTGLLMLLTRQVPQGRSEYHLGRAESAALWYTVMNFIPPTRCVSGDERFLSGPASHSPNHNPVYSPHAIPARTRSPAHLPPPRPLV